MPWFWKYVFEKNEGWRNILCRMRNHPNGIVYYTGPTALEPDYHCVDCGEEIN